MPVNASWNKNTTINRKKKTGFLCRKKTGSEKNAEREAGIPTSLSVTGFILN